MCALHYTLYQLYSRPLWQKYMNALGVSLAAGIAVKDSRNWRLTHTRAHVLSWRIYAMWMCIWPTNTHTTGDVRLRSRVRWQIGNAPSASFCFHCFKIVASKSADKKIIAHTCLLPSFKTMISCWMARNFCIALLPIIFWRAVFCLKINCVIAFALKDCVTFSVDNLGNMQGLVLPVFSTKPEVFYQKNMSENSGLFDELLKKLNHLVYLHKISVAISSISASICVI